MRIRFLCIVWLVAVLQLFIPIQGQNIVPATEEEVKSSPLLKDFDWKAYCQLYPDLPINGINTEFLTRKHYLEFGVPEGRLFPKILPDEPYYSRAQEKLDSYIKFLDDAAVPLQDRTFLVFHIGKFDSKNSIEIILNNLKIFQSAMSLDSKGLSGIFYWFNIVDGQDNMLFHSVHANSFNAALSVWSATPSDIYTHLRTLSILSQRLMKSFGSVFFLNNGVRGPLVYREEGRWIKPFRSLLFAPGANNAMVGATMSCEVAPHVQTHFFGIRSSIIDIVTTEYDAFHSFPNWPALVRFYEVGLTELIQRNGYNVSSLLYANRLKQNSFSGKCLSAVKFVDDHTVDNPSRWCDIEVDEVWIWVWGMYANPNTHLN
ncbi:hypothetical protein EON63_02105 [archaeon]|nr:MAG: hypothetical protein EON63_02105 [archaeon]